MSETTKASGEIPATLVADAPKAEATATESKPAVKKAPAKPAAKETHIADKIKALPRRRVWPD